MSTHRIQIRQLRRKIWEHCWVTTREEALLLSYLISEHPGTSERDIFGLETPSKHSLSSRRLVPTVPADRCSDYLAVKRCDESTGSWFQPLLSVLSRRARSNSVPARNKTPERGDSETFDLKAVKFRIAACLSRLYQTRPIGMGRNKPVAPRPSSLVLRRLEELESRLFDRVSRTSLRR